MGSEANKELVRRLYSEVWNKGNFELFDQIYAPGHKQHNPLPGQQEKGRDQLREGLRQMRAAFPDLRLEIRLMLPRRDEVAVVLAISGTHRGTEYIGVPPSGKLIAIAAMAIHRIANGKIVETWSSRDEESLFSQLRPGDDGRVAHS